MIILSISLFISLSRSACLSESKIKDSKSQRLQKETRDGSRNFETRINRERGEREGGGGGRKANHSLKQHSRRKTLLPRSDYIVVEISAFIYVSLVKYDFNE